jgi:hypothetical protein
VLQKALQHPRLVSSIDHTDIQLAKALNVNRTTAYRWRKAGCPTNDLEAAVAWAQNRKPAQKKTTIEVAASSRIEPANPTTEPEAPYSVRDRLQTQEQSISEEIAGLNQALEEARSTNDEKSAYKLLQALKSAREEHRRQADSLLKAEGRIIILEKNRGDLIGLDCSKSFVSKVINPVVIFLRKLCDAGRNTEEKALLATLGEAGLAILRDSAREAVSFTGK